MANHSVNSADVYSVPPPNVITGDIDGRDVKRVTQGVAVVYYVRMPDESVKIGTSQQFINRLRHSGMPGMRGKENVLALEFGSYDLERQRHEQFAHLRIGKTEKFIVAPDLLAHIDELRRQHNIAV